MHRSIRNRLEDLLWRERPAAGGPVAEHLASCEECTSELALMKDQALLLRKLRAPAGMEPAPGFYARVMQRIEERAKDSIWGAFIDSRFGKRLAYASLATAIALGSYVIGSELSDGHLGGPPVIAEQLGGNATVTGSLDERRDAVLVNFASYQPQRQEP
jgi:anti-sigma factor RsiW